MPQQKSRAYCAAFLLRQIAIYQLFSQKQTLLKAENQSQNLIHPAESVI
ncbi:hypothetical protein Hsw_2481 [Hymenobacter swuensis DY53]|uniref:Uncharacterized protein n=1 Tax=Hymenobacter swuensis DY53 TaxID=1227739 RepID=W8F636_9BACT|nr:hypothetical protein Hsw_2481 [Hymenobacter swuensis DY53]